MSLVSPNIQAYVEKSNGIIKRKTFILLIVNRRPDFQNRIDFIWLFWSMKLLKYDKPIDIMDRI